MAPRDADARRLRRRVAAWAAAAVVLTLVFAAYRNPHVVVDLANQLWACF